MNAPEIFDRHAPDPADIAEANHTPWRVKAFDATWHVFNALTGRSKAVGPVWRTGMRRSNINYRDRAHLEADKRNAEHRRKLGLVDPGTTHSAPQPQVPDTADAIIAQAMVLLGQRLRDSAVEFSSPETVRQYLAVRHAALEHEVFEAIWLDSRNRLIAVERLFTGTLTQTAVYPREVVKAALRHNAGAVILSHNHPSGMTDPSAADRMLTAALKQALTLVDVSVLDHVITAGAKSFSFAEKGLL